MKYPEWVLKHKGKNKEIRHVKNSYYLYEIGSVWDKKLKRARKITKNYIGKITEDGIVPKKEKRISVKDISNPNKLAVKEYGGVALIKDSLSKFQKELEPFFGAHLTNIIVVLASLKLLETTTFKRSQNYYEHSYLSNIIPNLNLNKTYISQYLLNIGDKRDKIVEFMKEGIPKNTQLLFDGTKLFSDSNMSYSQLGYTSSSGFGNQINILYAFDSKFTKPSYYRLVPGNMKDVTVFKNCLKETATADMTVIADKGFGSKSNIEMLEDLNLKYIIPLRRNSKEINYDLVEQGNKQKYEGYFIYNKTPIWYYTNPKTNGNYTVYTFLNESLKSEEEKDYLIRVQTNIEEYTDEDFFQRASRFGTLSIATNIEGTANEIYESYKMRNQIEVSFDMLKNLLGADRCYMQNDVAIEGWAFINHIALLMLYELYVSMKRADLLKKHSVKDVLETVKTLKKININGQWITTETSKKVKEIEKALKITL